MRVKHRKVNIVLAVVAAVLVGGNFLLPRLNRLREGAHVRCDQNMAQIGKAMLLYANDFGGRLPDQLTDLIMTQDLTSEILCCPSSFDERAEGPTAVEAAARIQAVGYPRSLHDPKPAIMAKGRHCSYIYVGQGLTWTMDASRVLLYEPLSNHDGDGCHVLFGDGHVKFITKDRIESLVAAAAGTYGRNP